MARILVVGKYYPPFRGGIEEVTRTVSEYAARDHDVTVLVHNHEPGSSETEQKGVTVIRRHTNLRWKGQPISFLMFRGIRLGSYDLIHFHSPNPFVTALFLPLRMFARKKPIVITHHMDIYGRKLLRAVSLPFVRHLVRIATAVIVTSAKNLAVSKDLPKNANYVVVPLGIDETEYRITPELRAEAKLWRQAITGNAPVVGFVGRIARYKGLKVLLEALSTLPGVHLMIAGDGEYVGDVTAAAEQMGLSDRLHLLGRIDHTTKLKLLSSIDAFIFPSTEITEAFGLSQVEAMLCGAPVVASNLPTGVTDVAIDGQTALLAEPGDAAMLSKQIARILKDRELADQLVAGARAHILGAMTSEIISKKTVDIFEAAMTNHVSDLKLAAST
ncbi:glycosyltransferase [soil metagenome]